MTTSKSNAAVNEEDLPFEEWTKRQQEKLGTDFDLDEEVSEDELDAEESDTSDPDADFDDDELDADSSQDDETDEDDSKTDSKTDEGEEQSDDEEDDDELEDDEEDDGSTDASDTDSKGKDDSKSEASDEEQPDFSEYLDDSDPEPKPEDNQQQQQQDIPKPAITEARRKARAAERSLRETQDELAAEKEKNQYYKRQAKVAGVELADEVPESRFTEEIYLEMSDNGQKDLAEVMLAQQREIDKLRAQQKPAPESTDDDDLDVDDSESDGMSPELQKEIDTAIDNNRNLSKWEAMNKAGKPAAWQLAQEVEKSLTNIENESVAARLKRVEVETIKRMKEGAKPAAEKSDPSPNRNLNDVTGSTGVKDNYSRINAMNESDKFDAMMKIEYDDPDTFNRLMSDLDS